jgi:hypothetical protein
MAEHFAEKHHALFLGRGPQYPIAMEGALKLKEISYIHAEAYPAGELKHGPLALVDADMPVVCVLPKDGLLEKVLSNLQEVRARGGELFLFADREVDTHLSGVSTHVLSWAPSRNPSRRSSSPYPATAGLSRRHSQGHRCGSAAQSGQIGHGGITRRAGPSFLNR